MKNITKSKNIILFGVLGCLLTSCQVKEEASEPVNMDVSNETVDSNTNVNNEKEIEDLEIYVATDIHYLSDSINDKGEAYQRMIENSDGRQLNYISELTDAFSYNIEKNTPDILIVSGDLTHNGELASHLDMAEKFKAMEESGTQVLVIPGNHDINNPYARAFVGSEEVVTDQVTAEEFEEIYSDFGYNEATLRDEKTLSYLATPTDDLWVLMLDTSSYDKNVIAPVTSGDLEKETLKWVKECSYLAKEKGAKIITVMHHNLYNHSELLYKGFTLDNADEVLETFIEADLDLVLSGHIHIQDIKADVDKKVYDVVTGSFIVYPIAYGIIDFDETGYSYRTLGVDVEGWAKESGVSDENLLDFNNYSKDYFYNSSVSGLTADISSSGIYTDEEVQKMADVIGVLNVNYFGGTVDNVREEILNSDGYKLWSESDDGNFAKAYIDNILEETTIKPTELRIDFK